MPFDIRGSNFKKSNGIDLVIPPQIKIVNASGVATTDGVGPSGFGEEWNIERYSITLSTGGGICRVYKNIISVQGFHGQIDYTNDGDGSTSENNSVRLKMGEKIFVQWTEATPGATATATIFGTKVVEVW